ncbi:DUF488 domain-containing protein [Rhodovastum atsumiense]|uniref:DUF488 domain-containing protein n=1 Tax=Rhodovastum atsumiense TaxID=504468 RepID=A0A5M6ITH4_9PROT|nr:DUF488 domain-containing protein [Rhodovastum atsumiense]KAA5611610.1 DUF488 domain-containing protein [Rhodovastum atsumiense]
MPFDVTTIGFTKTNAKGFFDRLVSAGVKVLYDVRLHNTSQLSGFAKADDLAFFLQKIGNIKYQHQPLLAPTDTMLKSFKRDKGDWDEYQKKFLDLMIERRIEDRFNPSLFDGACLLCSEATPHHCHRRLVCEYLNSKWGGALKIRHL